VRLDTAASLAEKVLAAEGRGRCRKGLRDRKRPVNQDGSNSKETVLPHTETEGEEGEPLGRSKNAEKLRECVLAA